MVRIIPPKMCSLCNSISSHAFTASYKVSCKVSQMFWFFIKCVLKWNIWDTLYKTLYNVDFLKNSSSSCLDSLFVLLNQLQFQRWLWLLLLYLLPLIVNYCSKGVSFSNRHVPLTTGTQCHSTTLKLPCENEFFLDDLLFSEFFCV